MWLDVWGMIFLESKKALRYGIIQSNMFIHSHTIFTIFCPNLLEFKTTNSYYPACTCSSIPGWNFAIIKNRTFYFFTKQWNQCISLKNNRGSYRSVHFINFIWNDHECKILFIIWLFKMGFYRLSSWHYFNRKYNVVTDGIMMLRASNQVLCNMWSYDFYDMTLATEY